MVTPVSSQHHAHIARMNGFPIKHIPTLLSGDTYFIAFTTFLIISID